MERDYSKYQPTEYEKYRMLRSNNRLVTFDQITHFAQFSSSDKTVTIHVSPKYEFMNMYEWIEDEGTEEQDSQSHSHIDDYPQSYHQRSGAGRRATTSPRLSGRS